MELYASHKAPYGHILDSSRSVCTSMDGDNAFGVGFSLLPLLNLGCGCEGSSCDINTENGK
jgi:hypothetical protein